MSNPFAKIEAKIRAFMRESLVARPSEGDFECLALDLYVAQRQANAAYARLCDVRGVGEVKDWREIPAVPTVAFKELEVTSLHGSERERVFYSSGTTQRDRSRHYHSSVSLELYEESLRLWFSHVFSKRIAGKKWLFLTPHGVGAPHSSLAHMFETIGSDQANEDVSFFGLSDEEGVWSLDCAKLVEGLKKFARERQPVAVLGTAFQFVHLLDELERFKCTLKLAPGSWILETGGYKGRAREIPKDELRRLLMTRLGTDSIFGEYGMSELSSQAYDVGDGVFRFPPWARGRVVSPWSGRDVTEGERGLIRVYDLANIWSVMAVQTEDIGIKMSDGFSLTGRAAQAEARGCSLLNV